MSSFPIKGTQDNGWKVLYTRSIPNAHCHLGAIRHLEDDGTHTGMIFSEWIFIDEPGTFTNTKTGKHCVVTDTAHHFIVQLHFPVNTALAEGVICSDATVPVPHPLFETIKNREALVVCVSNGAAVLRQVQVFVFVVCT